MTGNLGDFGARTAGLRNSSFCCFACLHAHPDDPHRYRANPFTPTSFTRFCRRPLTVRGLKGSRFQKRFQFRRETITRDFGCPWTPSEKLSIVRCNEISGDIPGGRLSSYPRAERRPQVKLLFLRRRIRCRLHPPCEGRFRRIYPL